MSDKVYDALKIIALIVLPAITTFAGTTLTALNFEYTEVVVVIMTAFDTMVGTIIKKISSDYYKNNVSTETINNIKESELLC